MKSRVFRHLGLAASVALNLWCGHLLFRPATAKPSGPGGASHHGPVAPAAASNPTPKTVPAANAFEASVQERVDKLREAGLSEEDVRAAMVPLINRHYFGMIFAGNSIEECGRAAGSFRNEREALFGKVFGADARRWRDEDPFDTTNYELKFEFTTPEAKERHECMSSLCGVSVEAGALASIVEIRKRHAADPAGLLIGLQTIVDEATATSIVQSTDEGYLRGYRRCMDLSPSVPERRRMAQSWKDIFVTRDSALNSWKAAQIPDDERAAGMRTVESQMADLLRDEIGQAAVDSVRINGW